MKMVLLKETKMITKLYRFIFSISLIASLATLPPTALRAQDNDRVSPNVMRAINDNTGAPAFGNGVTIVEFYDYQCGYCKASEEGLERLLKEDKYIRIVYMDFPKLGPLSLTTAKATLAAYRQGGYKYLWMHDILMNKDVHVSEPIIAQAAQQARIDVNQMGHDMTDDNIAKQIDYNIALGRAAGVTVTPSFIIGGHFVSGYLDYDQLKQMVSYARANRN